MGLFRLDGEALRDDNPAIPWRRPGERLTFRMDAPTPRLSDDRRVHRDGVGSDFPRHAEVRALFSGLLRATDSAILIAASVFTYWLRSDHLDMPSEYLVATGLSVLLLLNIGQMAGLYRYETLQHFPTQLGAVSLSLAAVMASLAMLSYLTKTAEIFSRLWLVSWFLTAYAGVVIVRVLAARRIEIWRAEGGLRRRLAIVGAGDKGARLIRHLRAGPDSDVILVGVFDNEHCGGEVEGIPVKGTVRELVAEAGGLDLDGIIVALPGDQPGTLADVMSELRMVPADITLCPDTIGIPLLGVEDVNGLGLLRVYRRPISGWSRVLKGIEDRVLAAILLVLFAPVMAVLALLIRLDSTGPIFFRQRRLGFNNNAFTLYKFRTMRHGAEDEAVVPQARRADPRVTRIGAILRRTSLDEIPQLINVLRGEMSLVGPRPHAIVHNQNYAALIDQYLGRHRVKPGITGWAQVNGLRGETETIEKMRARVEHDLYYIDHWSLWFDLRILLMTPFVGFVNRNAF